MIAFRSSPEVKALSVGTIKECFALYADNLIIFLSDPGPSVEVVLHILNEFGQRVNWSKSSILPLDSGARAAADSLCIGYRS